ncbi:MAG: response regulator [Lachnospiraceae bacterium]|nr:response regulator [Lachnospiraceae bacterium]
MPIDNIFDNMETVAASVIIVNTVTGKYRVLKKHWSFSNDYTDGIAWNDSVQAFKEHELLPEQENRDLVDCMRTENLVTALKDAETYISVDVQKKDTVWCRLRAVPSETDEEGNITKVVVTIANITTDVRKRFEEERLKRRYEALQAGMSRIHDSEFLYNLDEGTYHAFKMPSALVGLIEADGKSSDIKNLFINILKDSNRSSSQSDSYSSIKDLREKLSTKWLKTNLKGGRLVELDFQSHYTGVEKWYRISFSTVAQNEKGEPNIIMLFSTDITDNIIEEQRLKNELVLTNANLQTEMMLLRSFKNIYFLSVYGDLKANRINIIEAPESFRKECEKCDYDLDSICNVAIDTMVSEEFKEDVLTFLDDKTYTERFKDTDLLTFDYRDNNGRWNRINLIRVNSDNSGNAINVICAIQDIDQIKNNEFQYQTALIESAHAAERANQAKTQFLSQMSHDIRTPLNAIIGFSTIMLEESGDAEQVQDYTKKILSSGKQLLLLINDVLDMSKIESGKVELSAKPFSLFDMLVSVKEVIKTIADAKHQQFTMDIGKMEHDSFNADESRLNQILINLLNNSVKYTPVGGRITLSISSEPGNTSKYDRVTFIVEDTGYGMSKAFLEEAFKPFSREQKSDTASVQGTGLGLAITKNLVDLMGGTIDVFSEEGKGSRFTVIIPMKISEDEAEKKVEIQADDTNVLEGLNILVAEDNPLNSEIMTQIMKKNGATVSLAPNGQEAVNTFLSSDQGSFDLIFMDIQMPVMNGYEAARAIRAIATDESKNRPDAATIPIIAVTANAFTDDVREALLAGMNAHISKPINVPAMKSTVYKVLHNLNEEEPS